MSAAKRTGVPLLSRELNEKQADPGKFEDIPRIPKIAGDSKGLYV